MNTQVKCLLQTLGVMFKTHSVIEVVSCWESEDKNPPRGLREWGPALNEQLLPYFSLSLREQLQLNHHSLTFPNMNLQRTYIFCSQLYCSPSSGLFYPLNFIILIHLSNYYLCHLKNQLHLNTLGLLLHLLLKSIILLVTLASLAGCLIDVR